MFGMAYMFVHDGLVHRRFPVGPIADVPYLQKVAAAHQVLFKCSKLLISSYPSCAAANMHCFGCTPQHVS